MLPDYMLCSRVPRAITRPIIERLTVPSAGSLWVETVLEPARPALSVAGGEQVVSPGVIAVPYDGTNHECSTQCVERQTNHVRLLCFLVIFSLQFSGREVYVLPPVPARVPAVSHITIASRLRITAVPFSRYVPCHRRDRYIY